MLTEADVIQAAHDAGIHIPPRWAEVTGSTNTDLLALAVAGAPEWTVLVAGQQKAGRGRLGRTWVSTPGSSLLVSVLLRPVIAAPSAPLLSLAAAVAMAEACEEACKVEVRCKWPNDLVVGRRKLGGILAEASVRDARLDHVVIGVGVNLEQGEGDFPLDLQVTATSVAMEGGHPDHPALLREYLVRLAGLYGSKGEGLRGRVLGPYVERSDTLGRMVLATTRSGEQVVGSAEGITPTGALILRDRVRGDVVTVGSGDVEYLRTGLW